MWSCRVLCLGLKFTTQHTNKGANGLSHSYHVGNAFITWMTEASRELETRCAGAKLELYLVRLVKNSKLPHQTQLYPVDARPEEGAGGGGAGEEGRKRKGGAAADAGSALKKQARPETAMTAEAQQAGGAEAGHPQAQEGGEKAGTKEAVPEATQSEGGEKKEEGGEEGNASGEASGLGLKGP
jgi:hypothetical protein